MKAISFNARCPFKIGDVVRDSGTGDVSKITDIACTHYAKSGKTLFTYELDGNGRYIPIHIPEFIEISIKMPY